MICAWSNHVIKPVAHSFLKKKKKKSVFVFRLNGQLLTAHIQFLLLLFTLRRVEL